MQTINFMLSISLISIFCFIGIYRLPINLAIAETTSQEQNPQTSILEQIRNAITDKKPPVKEGGGGSRGNFCAIAPFSANETIEVFRDKPIFVWQGKVKRIRVKISGSEDNLWSVKVDDRERNKMYDGDELQLGETYEVLFFTEGDRYPFRVIDGDRRESIQADLEALAADGDATAEEVALQRASYFLEEGLLMDALREMLLVENPSVELEEAMGRISTAVFCKVE